MTDMTGILFVDNLLIILTSEDGGEIGGMTWFRGRPCWEAKKGSSFGFCAEAGVEVGYKGLRYKVGPKTNYK